MYLQNYYNEMSNILTSIVRSYCRIKKILLIIEIKKIYILFTKNYL